MTQDILFDASETGLKFEEYHKRNPRVWERFKGLVFALEAAGFSRISVNFVAELVRHGAVVDHRGIMLRYPLIDFNNERVPTSNGPRYVNFNNTYKTHYSRMFQRRFPEKAYLFETRRAKEDKRLDIGD